MPQPPADAGVPLPRRPAGRTVFPPATYGGPAGAVVYPDPPAPGTPWPLVAGLAPRPPRRRVGFVAIGVLVLVLGGGAVATYLVGRPFGDRGAATPEQAVEGFLTGIFRNHDAREAGRYVCDQAHDGAELDEIVRAVERQEDEYTAARTTWTYPAIRPDGGQAAAPVTLTMTTANEQVASREVTLLLLDDRGWWVCDVRTE